MNKYNTTLHQHGQINNITKIEKQIQNNSLQFSTVSPINDYKNDPRMSLTSVHLLNRILVQTICKTLINPLKIIEPFHYYYSGDSFHMTIKNIKVVNNPPRFSSTEVKTVQNIYQQVIPKHKKFKVFFYRLMLFPNNLSLIGTTDPELDNIVLDLNSHLIKAGVPDDKQYVNSQYFFSNITLVRFTSKINQQFIQKVNELSKNINFKPYEVDSVSLLSCNAVLEKQNIYHTWRLQ